MGCCRRCASCTFSCIKFVVFLVFVLLVYLLVFNVNVFGDQWRHRPLWMSLFSKRWIHVFDIRSEWLLFGDEDELTREGLKQLLLSVNGEAGLSRFGKFMAYGVILNQLSQRHCVGKAMAEKKRQGVALIEPSDPPIFVVGLPRTATTFIHGLLTEDEEHFRSPRFHEYMSACPPAIDGEDGGLFDPIYIELQGLKAAGLRYLLPDMNELHYMDGRTPDEDVIPLAHEMVSALYPTTFFLPSYLKWLQNRSDGKYIKSVEYLRQYLDVHLRRDRRRWLLKTPWHLVQLEELAATFPGGTFIWTHRDPVEQATSLTTLLLKLMGIGNDVLEYEEQRSYVARIMLDFWFWVLREGAIARKKLEAEGKATFIDVNFDDMRNKPMTVVEAIYKRLRRPLNDEARRKMMDYIEKSKSTKRVGASRNVPLPVFQISHSEIRDKYQQSMRGLDIKYV